MLLDYSIRQANNKLGIESQNFSQNLMIAYTISNSYMLVSMMMLKKKINFRNTSFLNIVKNTISCY